MLQYPLLKFKASSLGWFYKFYIYIYGHFGLKTTDILATYGVENFVLCNWHQMLRYPLLIHIFCAFGVENEKHHGQIWVDIYFVSDWREMLRYPLLKFKVSSLGWLY